MFNVQKDKSSLDTRVGYLIIDYQSHLLKKTVYI